MSFADDDIFEEPAGGAGRPQRRAGGRRGSGGRGGRPARTRGTGGGSPLQQPGIRILIAVGLLIVIVAILVSTIRGCQRNRLESSYKNYFAASNQIAKESGQQGAALQTLLDNKKFARKVTILPQIADLAKQADALVGRAKKLHPPDRLGAPNRTLITALEYRALGLGQLPNAIDSAYISKDKAAAAVTLASPLQILTASDVIYRTSFVAPAQDALQRDRIKNIQVSASEFFPGNTVEKATPSGAQTVIQKLKQVRSSDTATSGTPGTGKHGLGIVTVFAVRGSERKQLLPGTTVSLIGSADLKFEVTVENSGDFTESNVDVKFTYLRPDVPGGTPQTKTIDTIDPGEAAQKTLEFPLGGNPHFTLPSTIKVEVAPVPDEKNTSNNTAEYSVEFNLQ